MLRSVAQCCKVLCSLAMSCVVLCRVVLCSAVLSYAAVQCCKLLCSVVCCFQVLHSVMKFCSSAVLLRLERVEASGNPDPAEYGASLALYLQNNCMVLYSVFT